ncbi:MAG: hypothetical protein M0P05_03160 [Candidatus Colwellbacteria bacterium]|jgi:hypothetical protein|nr:hypothetical protein [Candidatus Colwellbacteria bacterium]
MRENPTIIHAFEFDGVIFPPVEAKCLNCMYSRSSIYFDPQSILVCGLDKSYVETDDWCGRHDLEEWRTDLTYEAMEYLEDHLEFIECAENNLLPGDRL